MDNIEYFHKPLYKDKRFLHEKYVVQGRSIAQIADEIFSSKEAVRANLLLLGIEVREQGKPHGRPSQPRFGQRLVNGQTKCHFAELRVVRAIQDLRREGLSYRQIASFLTQTGVPTKCRGKKWHPQMVKRILGQQAIEDEAQRVESGASSPKAQRS